MSASKTAMAVFAKINKLGSLSMGEIREEFPGLLHPNVFVRRWLGKGMMVKLDSGRYTVSTACRAKLSALEPLKTTRATPRTHVSQSTPWVQQRTQVIRAGAEDHIQIPSVVCGDRVYRKDANK